MKIVLQALQFPRNQRIGENNIVQLQRAGPDIIRRQRIRTHKEKRVRMNRIRPLLNNKLPFPLQNVDQFPELPKIPVGKVELLRAIDPMKDRKREVRTEKMFRLVLSDLLHFGFTDGQPSRRRLPERRYLLRENRSGREVGRSPGLRESGSAGSRFRSHGLQERSCPFRHTARTEDAEAPWPHPRSFRADPL